MMKKWIVFLVTMLVPSVICASSMTGVVGTEVLTDENGQQKIYSKLNLQPEFTFGKLGIGLDVVLYFDESGTIRSYDWEEWERIPEKFLYIRYAHKGDPVYIYYGVMKAMSIGHGMIFNRYSNALLFPDVRQRGLEIDLNFRYGGIETITTNVAQMQAVGARVYYRPWFSSSSLLRKIAFGVSAGTDVDPDENDTTTNDEVTVVGVDMEIPFVHVPGFSSIFFTDIAQMQLGSLYTSAHNYYDANGSTKTSTGSKDGGWGYASGFLGKVLMFDYRVEYKVLDNNFIYGYFDRFYEIEKRMKPHMIPNSSDPVKEGPYISLGYVMEKKFDCFLSWEDFNHDPMQSYPWVHAEVTLHKELFMDKAFWKFSYDKKNAESIQDLSEIKGKNTIIKTEWGYAVAENIMFVLIQEQSFDKNAQPTSRMTLEARVMF